MNTNIRRSLAATGAATILTALGAFATMQPASAMPADPGSPGTLSGNLVQATTTKEDACAALPYSEFNDGGSTWTCLYGYDEDQYDLQQAVKDVCKDSGGYYSETLEEFSDHTILTVLAECDYVSHG